MPTKVGSVERYTCNVLHDMFKIGAQFATNFELYQATQEFLMKKGVSIGAPDPLVAKRLKESYLSLNPRSRMGDLVNLNGQVTDYETGEIYELKDVFMFPVTVRTEIDGQETEVQWAHFCRQALLRE